MNSFFKQFLASFLAIIASFGFAVVALIVIIAVAAASLTSDVVEVEDNSVLRITLGETLIEDPSSEPLVAIDPLSFTYTRSMSLNNYQQMIYKASFDPKIKGIFIDVAPTGNIALEQLSEISSALKFFKESGKFIVAYGESFSQTKYYAASLADKVILSPLGSIDWIGLSSQVMFFKGALAKLDVEPEIIRHGAYKSAIEPFTESKMSKESREQTTALLGSVWKSVVDSIAVNRGLDSKKLDGYATSLSVASSKDALNLGLIDKIGYKDEANDYIASLLSEDSDDVEYISILNYSDSEMLNISKTSDNKVAIIYASGEIVSGIGESGQIGSNALCKKLVKAREDDDIKSVVLRINSPGGSALAADLIWREVELLQKTKPLIVSMGGVAASGGYYIAAPADVILAEPTTITGSIGVFGLMFNASKGLENKLGITVDEVSTNPSASLGSITRGLSNNERSYLLKGVEDVYKTFVYKVAKGRNMSFSSVDKVAQGRVWSGVNALEIGLIDGYGSLNKAILLAANKVGLGSNYQIYEMIGEKSPFDEFAELLIGTSVKISLPSPIFDGAKEIDRLRNMSGKDNIQTLMPYTLDIK